MEAAQTGKVGRVVPTRRGGHEANREAAWLANDGSPHPGALGTARPTLPTNNFGACYLAGTAGHARRFNNKENKERK
jgi:hypothetical protein